MQKVILRAVEKQIFCSRSSGITAPQKADIWKQITEQLNAVDAVELCKKLRESGLTQNCALQSTEPARGKLRQLLVHPVKIDRIVEDALGSSIDPDEDTDVTANTGQWA